jgi:hypothetical protein
MTYDNEGRLSSWTAPQGSTGTDQFLYDNEGNRVLQRSSTSSVSDTITFDGYSEVVITRATSTITNYFSVAGQRVAMQGKPIMDGVGQAAISGALTGGVMEGAGALAGKVGSDVEEGTASAMKESENSTKYFF